jgi:thiol:disulfide interchange protein DsbD
MMKKVLLAALLALAPWIAAPADAEVPARPLQPDQAFALSVGDAGDGTLRLTWDIAEGYYLYRSRLGAKTADGVQVPLSLPQGEPYADPNFGEEEIYHGKLTAGLAAPDGAVTLHWQGCQEGGICYAPQTASLLPDGTLAPPEPPAAAAGSAFARAPDGASGGVTGGDDATISDSTLSLAQGEGVVERLAERGGAALVVLGFLGFGLLLAFTPCVFPMFPIVAGMLARQGETLTARRGLMLTGAYVLAMAAAFGLLGVVAAWSGANLQVALQSPLALGVVAVLFVALALSMFGLYDLQMPSALQSWLGRTGRRRGSLGGAAALGFTSALIVGPCVTAPLAGALVYIAQTGDVALGAAALFALGLGQGLPLVAVGLFGPRILPRSGAWMEGAKRVFGVIFLGFAIWLAGRVLPGPAVLVLWAALMVGAGVFLGARDRLDPGTAPLRRINAALGMMLIFAGLVQGLGAALGAEDPLRPLAPLIARGGATAAPAAEARFASVTTGADLDRALAAAGSRPALVYVTADWCVTCRVIERGPLADPAVHAALAGLAPIKVDVSDFNAEAQALMQRLAAAGPPTMVFLDAMRAEAPDSRLIGEVDSAGMLASIARVALQ